MVLLPDIADDAKISHNVPIFALPNQGARASIIREIEEKNANLHPVAATTASIQRPRRT
jgi:hypothetical protein